MCCSQCTASYHYITNYNLFKHLLEFDHFSLSDSLYDITLLHCTYYNHFIYLYYVAIYKHSWNANFYLLLIFITILLNATISPPHPIFVFFSKSTSSNYESLLYTCSDMLLTINKKASCVTVDCAYMFCCSSVFIQAGLDCYVLATSIARIIEWRCFNKALTVMY